MLNHNHNIGYFIIDSILIKESLGLYFNFFLIRVKNFFKKNKKFNLPFPQLFNFFIDILHIIYYIKQLTNIPKIANYITILQ